MASNNDKKKPTPGVRGPGGPPPAPAPGSKQGGKPANSAPQQRPGARLVSGSAMPTKPASPLRRRFEDVSLPIVTWLQGVPKFVVIITPGLLLFLGLIQTGGLAWLGGILLLVVAFLLAWLTALSWPVVSTRSKIVRVVIILVVVGFAVMKFLGRF